VTLSAEDRRAQIAQWVSSDGWVNVSELARHYVVSQVSIRRDLEALEHQGFLKRVHGGALPVAAHPQDDVYSQRAASQAEAKRRIAKAAAALVKPSDRIILDSGSTVAEVARQVATEVPHGQHLRIITGSTPVVEALTPYPQIQLLVLGGIYLHQYRTVVGPQTLSSLEGLHVDKMFLGSDGLTLETGNTTANVLEAEVTRSMVHTAEQVIVVADSSKFGKAGFCTLMPVQEIDILLTDSDAPPELVAELRKLGVDVRLV